MKKFANWLFRLTHRSEIKAFLTDIELSTVSATTGVVALRDKYQEHVNAYIRAGRTLKILRTNYVKPKRR